MPPKTCYMPLGMYETAVTQSSLSTVWKKDVTAATGLRNKLQTLLSTDSAILTSLQSTKVRTTCHQHSQDEYICFTYKTKEDEKKAKVCSYAL